LGYLVMGRVDMRFEKKILQRVILGLICLTLTGAIQSKTLAENSPRDNDLLVPILAYHRIVDNPTSELDVTPKQLKAQFKFFKKNGYHPITAAQFIEYQQNPEMFPEKPLVITFDDGPKSHYTKAYRLLRRFRWKATFFIYTNVVAEKSDTQITWKELKKMSKAGMDIQSHTVSHPFLTKKSAAGGADYLEWLKQELEGSKNLLEEKLQHPVFLLAYPYGWYNNFVEDMSFQAGYQGVFTVNFGINRTAPGERRYYRFVIDNTMDLDTINSFLTVKPMQLEILTPQDGTTISSGITEIKFRIKNVALSQVEVKFRRTRGLISPNAEGVFVYKLPKTDKLTPGYQMIIVKTRYSKTANNYLTSWGFEYKQPAEEGGK
jgi:peptidoglycan/xylan/chitin deacetylase (PgdA/CDA1 family)